MFTNTVLHLSYTVEILQITMFQFQYPGHTLINNHVFVIIIIIITFTFERPSTDALYSNNSCTVSSTLSPISQAITSGVNSTELGGSNKELFCRSITTILGE